MRIGVSIRVRQVVCVLIAIALLAGLYPCKVVANEKQYNGKVLKVAFYPLDGFFEYSNSGSQTGYGVELLNEISKYTGIRFEYVRARSWEETKRLLLSRDADIRMPGNLPTTPSTTLSYTTESVMDTYHAIMTLENRDDLYYKDYENFATLKIAITKSLYDNTAVHKYLDEVGITEKNLVMYDEYDRCKEALKKRQVDALISNIMDLTDDMKILARFYSVSNYISMIKGNPYLKVLDTALRDIKMDDPSFLSNLYQKYYPERTSVPFTREEVEYIKNADVITVGEFQDHHPFSSYDQKTKELSGMTEDILTWISGYTGLKFEQQPMGVSQAPISELKSGKFDMVAGVLRSQQFISDREVMISSPYSASSITIVKRKGEPFYPTKEQTIVVKSMFQALHYYLSTNCPQYHVIYRDNDIECLDALQSGEADIMLQNVYVMDYLLQKPKYAELEMLPTTFLQRRIALRYCQRTKTMQS